MRRSSIGAPRIRASSVGNDSRTESRKVASIRVSGAGGGMSGGGNAQRGTGAAFRLFERRGHFVLEVGAPERIAHSADPADGGVIPALVGGLEESIRTAQDHGTAGAIR